MDRAVGHAHYSASHVNYAATTFALHSAIMHYEPSPLAKQCTVSPPNVGTGSIVHQSALSKLKGRALGDIENWFILDYVFLVQVCR